MDQTVQDPVGEHGQAHYNARLSACRAREKLIGAPADARPENGRQQAMRVGHVVQIERIRRGDSGHDAHLLDAQENARGPENVQKLYRQKKHPERNRRLSALGGEARAIVAYKHCSLRSDAAITALMAVRWQTAWFTPPRVSARGPGSDRTTQTGRRG